MTEGEIWTREQLQRLLDARFAPRAVAGFLVASQRRSNAIRRERPDLAVQEARWVAAGAVAAAALAPSGRRRAALGWWALTALMLDWHLGMLESEDGAEPRLLGPADALTLARCWLVPVAAASPAPAVVLLAGVSDVLDGRIARASGRTTRAGRDLEGLVDTCFGIAALRGARRTGLLGPRVTAAELGRLTAGVSYGLWVYFGRAERPDPAVVRAARLTTPLRAGGLLVAGLGHRGAGERLLLAGSGLSVAAVLRALRAG